MEHKPKHSAETVSKPNLNMKAWLFITFKFLLSLFFFLKLLFVSPPPLFLATIPIDNREPVTWVVKKEWTFSPNWFPKQASWLRSYSHQPTAIVYITNGFHVKFMNLVWQISIYQIEATDLFFVRRCGSGFCVHRFNVDYVIHERLRPRLRPRRQSRIALPR